MIYLDHNATSPLLAEVLTAMEPWFGVPANPSSVHRAGQRAAAAMERARSQIAEAVGATPDQVVFTSGATEANALALHVATQRVAGLVAASRAEHPSVWKAAEDRGWTELLVDEHGRIRLQDAGILAVQAVNHETGVIQADPRGRARHVHVDATQALGRVALDFEGLDSMALSAHKLGGPPGMGALILRGPAVEAPLVRGGSQERGRRPGTVPTALVVGFGEACALAVSEREARVRRWQSQRKALERAVHDAGGQVLGEAVDRVANTVCAVFPGLLGESVVQALDLRGICVSSGAACASGSTEPSPVLAAMGHPEPRGGVRFSLGPRTTDSEVQEAAQALSVVVPAVRQALAWE